MAFNQELSATFTFTSCQHVMECHTNLSDEVFQVLDMIQFIC